MSAVRDNPPQRHTTGTRTAVIVDTGTDTTARREQARRSSRTADRATRRHNNPNHNGTVAGRGDALTTDNPHGRPEREDVNADNADGSGKVTVIVQAQDFRLPDVLKHVEAGKIVLVIP